VLVEHGVYPMPIGSKGVAMVDARDIAEVAAIELIRREQAADKPPIGKINVVGPNTLMGADITAIWSDVLGRPVVYGGDDPSGFEQTMATFMPAWTAYEMRLMASATSATAPESSGKAAPPDRDQVETIAESSTDEFVGLIHPRRSPYLV
jgi:uncharacterized protein YbjT (DUF2867 family)